MIIQFYKTIWWNLEHLSDHLSFTIFTACYYFIKNSETPSHSNQWKQWLLKNSALIHIDIVANKIEKHHFKTAYSLE